MRFFKKHRFSLNDLRNGEQKVFFKAGDQWCYLWTAPSFNLHKKIPVVIHHHGAGGYVKNKRADWLMTESKSALLKAVMEGGACAIAGSHACGAHWGNTCAVNANVALLRVLDKCPGFDTNRLGLIGGGLGGALVWNSVLGPFEDRVKLVAVLQGVANLEAVIKEHRFKEACLKAHGIRKKTPDDEVIVKIQQHDPMQKLKSLKKGTRLPKTAIYHGAKDTNIPPATHAILLADSLKMAGGKVDLEIFDEMEHNVYEMGRSMEKKLRDFFTLL